MCGIAGGTHINPGALDAALAEIGHRGPDARGCWRDPEGKVALGHVRLAIIDLDPSANQPMVCPRTGNVLSFNGEIYNFRALRDALGRMGWRFRTRSDTEVLLGAYGQWGLDCLRYLNGMFAFSVYEPRQRRVVFARDRVGKKPLFYSLWGPGLVWGSEVKALFMLRPDLPRDLEEDGLGEYMELGYIPGPLTVYRHVRKLPPAHCAVYDLDSRSFEQRRYWRLPAPAGKGPDDRTAEEELEGLLRDAVKLRLESDVPVGIFLSGGLDSSLVAAMAARENPDLVAYTVRFPVARYDESAVAESVAKWVGVRHRVLPVEAADGGTLADLSFRIDEPFADSSLLPTYLVSRAIRRHVKVALSGDGGDELFAGYGYYGVLRDEASWDRVPGPLRALLSSAHVLLPVGTRGKNFLRRLGEGGVRRFLLATHRPEAAPCCPLADAVSRKLRRIPADRYRRSLLEEMDSRTDCAPSLSLLQMMTRLDFSSYLPDDILVKVDRASMLCSLEVRSPLLDYRISEFAFSLPDRLRLNGATRKYLLAKVARKYLPPDFPFDRKQGFSIPEAEWLAGEWRGLLDDVFREKSSLLDPRKVARIRRLHDRTGRFGPLLFRILMLAQFEKRFGISLNGD